MKNKLHAKELLGKLMIELLIRLSRLFPDRLYIKMMYRLVFGNRCDLSAPKLFNEKLNWLKLNNRDPKFTTMVDKYRVKSLVGAVIGPEYVVPCYGYWKNVDDIDFSKLPQKVFLKSTHDSGGGILVDQEKGIDYAALRKRFNKRTLQGKNWYWHLREWPYRDVPPAIIAEEYLVDQTNCVIRDYKFFCFNGVPMYMYITNKGGYIYENFYDMDFSIVDISHGFERRVPEYSVPENFDKMKQLAAILSAGYPFIRIDFFNVNGKLYFGEFTFYDWGGMKPLSGEWEKVLGDLIVLN